jgi:3-methyladenine DNA glycosylase AlkD
VTSAVTARADAFVAAHLAEAGALAARVAPLLDHPDAFVSALEAGLRSLADPAHLDELRRMTPGVTSALGVRTPLTRPIHAAVRRAGRRRPDIALWLAERVEREPYLEVRAFACTLLRLTLEDDPERSWQLVRRMARAADNWIAVDTLAGVAALGILLEPFRWAELEQLVYAPSPWERRLVGSTIATLPFEVVPEDRPRLTGTPALALVGQLIGDADENVQKALAWALRNWTRVDAAGVERFLDEQAASAAAERDGHRARVVRDALASIDPDHARRLRARVAAVRRSPHAPSTSTASRATAAFADLIATDSSAPISRFASAGSPPPEPERSLTE